MQWKMLVYFITIWSIFRMPDVPWPLFFAMNTIPSLETMCHENNNITT
jgi:hypothetical protein